MRADLMAQFIDAIRSGRPKTSGPSIRPGGPIGHAFGDSCDPPVAPIIRAMGTTIKQAAALAEARVEAQRLAEGR